MSFINIMSATSFCDNASAIDNKELRNVRLVVLKANKLLLDP